MASSPPRVSPLDLSARLRNDAVAPLLLDVRTPLEHREVHLDGARLMPLDELDAATFTREEGKDREVVVICRSGGRATKAAERLAAAGMERVHVLEGGTLAWLAAGLPATHGPKGLSLERQVRIAAGSLVLAGLVLGTWIHPGFYGLSAFVGAGLVFAGLTDWCGMGLLLAKAPWNKVSATDSRSSCCVTSSPR